MEGRSTTDQIFTLRQILQKCREHQVPGVVGCIDSTHIPILRPTKDEHMYFNRKGFHSINAMIVNTDHNYRILAINPRFGGAAHDSFVWDMSAEREFFEENFRNGESRLLGDSGYCLAPWLLTPYRNAYYGSGEEKFNSIHSTARCSVERGIGVLKSRWRCLSSDRKLRYSPKKITAIINVCCALQNMCIAYNVAFDLDYMLLPADQLSVTAEMRNDSVLDRRAQRIRDAIRDSLLD
ncbi:putative nuclease HARBI1 [Uranotaenia lowii]|uniref:putative nuclease HARBI1 n=1 Tax=Uranotaenia lowii TaxID=190385 RepID=UPI002478C94B|nr:putative nuclease HARBI1 [Uranotaenia lowii]